MKKKTHKVCKAHNSINRQHLPKHFHVHGKAHMCTPKHPIPIGIQTTPREEEEGEKIVVGMKIAGESRNAILNHT